MKDIAKPISIILLIGMIVSICLLGWFGIDSNLLSNDTLEVLYSNSDSAAARAFSDGKYSGLELFYMAEEHFEEFSDYVGYLSEFKSLINATYNDAYGVTYPTYFACYLCSLISMTALLVSILLHLFFLCRNSPKSSWSLIPLSVLSMVFYIVCVSAAALEGTQLYYGGFITIGLAIGVVVFHHFCKTTSAKRYQPLPTAPPVYSSGPVSAVRHSSLSKREQHDDASESRIRSTMRKK